MRSNVQSSEKYGAVTVENENGDTKVITDNMIENGDFETGSFQGWKGSANEIHSGGLKGSGFVALNKYGISQMVIGSDEESDLPKAKQEIYREVEKIEVKGTARSPYFIDDIYLKQDITSQVMGDIIDNSLGYGGQRIYHSFNGATDPIVFGAIEDTEVTGAYTFGTGGDGSLINDVTGEVISELTKVKTKEEEEEEEDVETPEDLEIGLPDAYIYGARVLPMFDNSAALDIKEEEDGEGVLLDGKDKGLDSEELVKVDGELELTISYNDNTSHTTFATVRSDSSEELGDADEEIEGEEIE